VRQPFRTLGARRHLFLQVDRASLFSEQESQMEVEQIVNELEAAVVAFRDRLSPGTIDDHVNLATTKFREKFQSNGIDVTPADILGNFEAETRAQYDVGLRTDAAKLDADLDANVTAMAKTINVLSQLPDPVAAAEHGEITDAVGLPLADTLTLRETRKMTALLGLERAERKLGGKTPTAVAKLYEATGDKDVVRYVIEQQAETGWPDVRLDVQTDVTGLVALTKMIAKTRRTRLEKEQPALVAAEKRLAALRGSATLYSLFDHIKRGRGFATAPRPRKVNLR
jgi:hypothetical protein